MTNTNSGRRERLDPRFDVLVPSDISLDVLVDFGEREGPHWLEGPVWDRRNSYLLFSDVKANAIQRWERDGEAPFAPAPQHPRHGLLMPSGQATAMPRVMARKDASETKRKLWC